MPTDPVPMLVRLTQPVAQLSGQVRMGPMHTFKLIILSMPVALLASCDVLVGTGKDGGWDERISIGLLGGIFVLIWVALVVFALKASTKKQSLVRLSAVLAVVGFLTPIPGAVHWLAAGHVSDPIFPVCTMFILGLMVGIPACLTGVAGYRHWRRAEMRHSSPLEH